MGRANVVRSKMRRCKDILEGILMGMGNSNLRRPYRVLVAPPLALEVALGRDGLRGIPRRHADGVIRLGANGRDNGRAEAGKTCSPECPCLLELRARELADLLPRGVRVRINDVFVVRIISRVWPRRCIGPVPAAGASHYLLEDAVIVVHAVSVRVRALVCVGQAARGAADIANEGRLRVARRAEPGLVAAHECGARGTEHSRGGVFIVACLRALEGKQQEEGGVAQHLLGTALGPPPPRLLDITVWTCPSAKISRCATSMRITHRTNEQQQTHKQ